MSSEPMDGRAGRKPICEVFTEQGWRYRSTWSVVVGAQFLGAQLVMTADQRTGEIALSIERYELPEFDDDGA